MSCVPNDKKNTATQRLGDGDANMSRWKLGPEGQVARWCAWSFVHVGTRDVGRGQCVPGVVAQASRPIRDVVPVVASPENAPRTPASWCLYPSAAPLVPDPCHHRDAAEVTVCDLQV